MEVKSERLIVTDERGENLKRKRLLTYVMAAWHTLLQSKELDAPPPSPPYPPYPPYLPKESEGVGGMEFSHKLPKEFMVAEDVQAGEVPFDRVTLDITLDEATLDQINQAVLRVKRRLSPTESLVLTIKTSEDTPVEEAAEEIANLIQALNEYHIALGGSGLEIDDWEILVPAKQTVGV